MDELKLRALLQRACLGLPEVRETVKWGHPTFEAGKKMFAVLDKYDGQPCIAFKVAPGVAGRAARRRTLLRRAVCLTTRVGVPASGRPHRRKRTPGAATG